MTAAPLTAQERAEAAEIGATVFDQTDIDKYAKTHEAELALQAAYRALKPHESTALFRLFEAGEVTEDTPSDADSHLFKLLALAGIRDPERLARIGRKARIATQVEMWVDGRPGSTDTGRAKKWARDDYVARTIQHALGSTAAESLKRSTPAPEEEAAERVAVLDDSELAQMPDPSWVIDGLVPADAGVLLYGRRSVYKSFALLDWLLSVQTGKPWLGRTVAQGQTAYVAAEGWGALKLRVAAWKRAHKFVGKAGALFVKGASLKTDTAVEKLIERLQAKAGERPLKIIGLDTLNRLIPGIEENSPEAMGRTIGITDRLRAAFPGSTVVWVHHSGWDDLHERGHSSLGDDLDTVIHAQRDENAEALTVDIQCEKQKDAGEFAPLRLTLALETESLVVTGAEVVAGKGTSTKEHKPGRQDALDHLVAVATPRALTIEELMATTGRSKRWLREELPGLIPAGRMLVESGTGTKGDPHRYRGIEKF
jgi:hypothetical protein